MFIPIILLVIIDQIIKAIVKKHMIVGMSFKALGDVMSITYVRNTGAAFSIFAGNTRLLAVVSLTLVFAIVIYVTIYHDKTTKLERAALTLIIAGGLGNCVDRFVLGFVVDYLDFHFWPVFNFADILVCVGAVLLIISLLSPNKSLDKEDYKGFAIPEYDESEVHIPGVGGDDILNANKRMNPPNGKK